MMLGAVPADEQAGLGVIDGFLFRIVHAKHGIRFVADLLLLLVRIGA
jgi:hypothetical protein